jgi:hypothetical protein
MTPQRNAPGRSARGSHCPAVRPRWLARVMERIGVLFLSRAIGIADAVYLLALRCPFDNDRMELTGQLSNLSLDLQELLSRV